MSGLRPPGLGPIVGHVTHQTARLWIRAGDPADSGADIAPNRRTIGVIALREMASDDGFAAAYYFRLKREYDRTGVFTFGESTGLAGDEPSPSLSPDTPYEARVGTLTIDDPDPDAASIDSDTLRGRLPPPETWIPDLRRLDDAEAQATFTTAPDPGAEPGDMAFLLGSCRYPGILWKARHADAIFGPMRHEALGETGRAPARFVLMVGDQIYADRLNRNVPIALADTFAEFQERYLTAFGSRNMRRLLRSVPTYMILDDHEIEDNWSQDRIRSAKGRNVFNLAINAYMSYQWLHGPRNFGVRLFYDFACGGYPFFVLDERTQRYKDDVEDSLDDNHLLGRPSLSEDEPSQLDLLLRWLSRQQEERGNVPKFVVSPSVFVPNPITAREGREGTDAQKARWREESDSWAGFPTTRQRLLAHVVEEGVQNLVFLSGDIHCANVARMRFTGTVGAEKLRAYSITSSAFYWPFPFADGEPSNFVHDSRGEGQEDTFAVSGDVSMDYEAWNFTQEDNFSRIDVERDNHRLVVVPYGYEGQQLEAGGLYGFGGDPLRAELELEPW